MMNNLQNKNNALYIVMVITMVCNWHPVESCGGGVVPYVPTQTGASGSNQPTGQFYLIEKGIVGDMFDIKKLQPLLRNVILTGNERTTHNSKNSKTTSEQTVQDSTAKNKEISPVLNIHRFH